MAWKIPEPMPQQPSLLLIGERIYLVTNRGLAACVEAKTGRFVWKQRIAGEYAASPIYADGRIYLFSDRSVTTVIEPGDACKIVATSRLDGRMMASPAVAGKAIFLRTESHLYRIEK